MAMTGSSVRSSIPADTTKEVVSYIVAIPAGAGVAQVVNPAVPVQAVMVDNNTSNLIRGLVTFTAGITSATPAAQRVFLVNPGSVVHIDFSDHDGDNAVGSIDAIDSVSFTAVQPGAVTAEASTLAASTAAVAGMMVVNLTSA